MIKRVSRKALIADPYHGWNTFIEILAMGDAKFLTAVQRRAQLLFRYDSEVQNGGHLQYFCNQSDVRVDEVTEALKVFGLLEQVGILERADVMWNSKRRSPISSIGEFVREAIEGEFAALDEAYSACASTVVNALNDHLKSHFDEYIETVE